MIFAAKMKENQFQLKKGFWKHQLKRTTGIDHKIFMAAMDAASCKQERFSLSVTPTLV